MMIGLSEEDRNMLEKAIFLPMALTVLNKDLIIFQKGPFKLKQPYINLVEQAMKKIQMELSEVKRYLKENDLKVYEIKRDEAFTMYSFIYKGYEEQHSYFNPKIRNIVQELLEHYLSIP